MNILIPMAGAGSRFKKEGYKISKPLILVNQKPMVVEATNHLPKGDKYIYICIVKYQYQLFLFFWEIFYEFS